MFGQRLTQLCHFFEAGFVVGKLLLTRRLPGEAEPSPCMDSGGCEGDTGVAGMLHCWAARTARVCVDSIVDDLAKDTACQLRSHYMGKAGR